MDSSRAIIKLMVTIVDRGLGEKVTEICREESLHYHTLCLGMGTASSEILDYLGLGKTEKDVVVTMAPSGKLPSVLEHVSKAMQLKKPGRGIAFTLPISGISSLFSQLLTQKGCEEMNQELKGAENGAKYELVVAIARRGYADKIMGAARSVGAAGGTIIDARGIGYQEAEKILGSSIQAEKSIVCILCRREDKRGIMQAVSRAAGIKTEARGLLLSLAVDELAGMGDLTGGQVP